MGFKNTFENMVPIVLNFKKYNFAKSMRNIVVPKMSR